MNVVDTQGLIAGVPVLVVGVLMCLTPVFTRPTLQFGVRVPAERAGAPVIRRERTAYHWRTGALAVCFAAAAAAAPSTGWQWLSAVLVLLELAAGFGCFLVARERISAVKRAEGWYDGLRQTVAVDTSWRTEPERFPALWLIPAVATMAATAVVGIVRYPALPARLAVHFTLSGAADRYADKSVWSAFSLLWAQVFTTALIAGLLALIHRSRPETEAADVAGSTRRYRVFVGAMGRGLLVCAALTDVSLLLAALQLWGFYRLSGGASVLLVLPALLGGLALVVVAVRMGQAGSRLGGERDAARSDRVDRDDDRLWKGGLFYVNRDDPALMVGKRFGVGWTVNFGNPKAWWLVGGLAVLAVALTVVKGA